MIGDRLRSLRQQRNLSQRDVEERSGLLRCYISRVENGHTAPSIETLEKMARAFDLPMYRLFYDGDKPPDLGISLEKRSRKAEWGTQGKDARLLRKLQQLLAKMDERERRLLLAFAIKATQQRKVR